PSVVAVVAGVAEPAAGELVVLDAGVRGVVASVTMGTSSCSHHASMVSYRSLACSRPSRVRSPRTPVGLATAKAVARRPDRVTSESIRSGRGCGMAKGSVWGPFGLDRQPVRRTRAELVREGALMGCSV